jgi:hypothetical protein
LRLYQARGYVPAESIRHPLADGLSIEFVPMSKAPGLTGPEAHASGG